MNIDIIELPKEFFLRLENNPHLLGRVTLNLINDCYAVEVDIVFKEGRKIFTNIGQFFEYEDPLDAVEFGVQKLRDYLQGRGQVTEE